MNVKEVVETILNDTCGDFRLEKTCDQLISGEYHWQVTGIVTTFMATVDVIKQSIDRGANLIITHEPTFYTADDELDWLVDDPLYLEKKKLIEENNIAIWRFHDHMHEGKSDRIYDGLLNEIGADLQLREESPRFTYIMKEKQLLELATYLKEKFSLEVIKIVGNPKMLCSKLGILVGGASLGLGREQMPMEFMRDNHLDVIICGEITEWTLCAYVNDASMLKMNKGMIIVGHERSEEWGMKYMAEWLAALVPSIPVSFVDAKEPFIYL